MVAGQGMYVGSCGNRQGMVRTGYAGVSPVRQGMVLGAYGGPSPTQQSVGLGAGGGPSPVGRSSIGQFSKLSLSYPDNSGCWYLNLFY